MQDTKPQTQSKCLPTAPGVCSRFVCELWSLLTAVCVHLDGLNAEPYLATCHDNGRTLLTPSLRAFVPRSASWDSNSGHLKCNGTAFQSAAHKAISANVI